MSCEGPLRRYTCDKCRRSELVKEGVMPSRWLSIDIRSDLRMGRIKHLCGECRNDLDRHLFPLANLMETIAS